MVPRAEVEESPLTDMFASASTRVVPKAEVATCEPAVTLAFATTVTVPRALVAAKPVRVTGIG
jgi:hypothetical protein